MSIAELKKDIVFDTGQLDDLIAPPFSIIDLEKHTFKARKNLWCEYLPKLDNQREDKGEKVGRQSAYDVGKRFATVSVFNPFVCELIYKWFSNHDSKVLDPFAGGCVRGFTASYLDRQYTGIDVNQNQVNDNNKYLNLLKDNKYIPNYVCCSSADFKTDQYFDLLFTCPPYYDLEQYDGGEKDLSMLPSYDQFLIEYQNCLSNCCKYIKPNSFACIVVGNFRDKNGFYYDFVGDTIRIMQKSGFNFYNEIIIKTPVGSACLLANNLLKRNRKVAKIHQNLLVFFNGYVKDIHLDNISKNNTIAQKNQQISVFDFL